MSLLQFKKKKKAPMFKSQYIKPDNSLLRRCLLMVLYMIHHLHILEGNKQVKQMQLQIVGKRRPQAN